MLASLQTRGRLLAPETRGALGVLFAMFLFAMMDSMAKHLGGELPALQVVWARYASQTALILALFLPRLPELMRTNHPRMQLVRGLCLFTATSLFFSALSFLGLAEAVALMQTAPLFIVVLAALVLAEPVGPRRWIAVGIGLIGALVILRPGLGVFQPAALLALGSAVALACYQIATRRLGGGDSIWTTLVYTTVTGTILASLVLPFIWVTPTAAQVALMCVIGLPGFVGHFALVWALGQAEASVLAPFNYSGLIWAILYGFVLFGEVPGGPTVAGALIVTGAGLFVWHRERLARVEASLAAGRP